MTPFKPITVNGKEYPSVRHAYRATLIPIKRLYQAAREGREYRAPIDTMRPHMTPEQLIETYSTAEVGARIVYHEGPAGSAPSAIKRAAADLPHAHLVQKFSGRLQGAERVFQYIAVKGKLA